LLPTSGQARNVSRIAPSVASDGKPTSRVAIAVEIADNAAVRPKIPRIREAALVATQ
jgi:hypothetical protein